MEKEKVNKSESGKASDYESLTFENDLGVVINSADIVCVFCWQPYLKILLYNGNVITVKESLKSLLGRLWSKMFWKTHRSHIIHLKYAKRYCVYGRGMMVELEIEKKETSIIHVPVAKRSRQEFEKRIRRITTIARVLALRCPVHIFDGEPVV